MRSRHRAHTHTPSRTHTNQQTNKHIQVVEQGPTDEEKQAIRAAINNAKTPEQLDQIERMSRAGVYDIEALKAIAAAQ